MKTFITLAAVATLLTLLMTRRNARGTAPHADGAATSGARSGNEHDHDPMQQAAWATASHQPSNTMSPVLHPGDGVARGRTDDLLSPLSPPLPSHAALARVTTPVGD